VVVTDGPAPAEVAQCPYCGWPAGPGDNFCEACRTDLRLTPPADLSQPFPAEPPPAQTAVSSGGNGHAARCAFCPAAGASIDGYCESCGRKLPADADHCELDLGLLAGVTDRGLRHARNEDAMALATAYLATGPVAVATVCDGVSSSPRPQDASQAAARALVQVIIDRLTAGADPEAASAEAVRHAREAVAALASPDADTPAATFVSAVLTSDAVTLCWLGDSRGYWLGLGPVPVTERLTEDDSVAAEMVAAGLVSESEALALPQAHVVTRWIGEDAGDSGPHVMTFRPPGPGVLLLCSDGLWNYQPDAAGLARMALPGALTDPLGAAATLVRFALGAGGADNVTVVLAPFPLARRSGPAVPAGQAPDPAMESSAAIASREEQT
jgi:serine/threonine protein phosphatase PrpC